MFHHLRTAKAWPKHSASAVVFAAAAVLMTYPLCVRPGDTARDAGDPLLFAWILAWMTRALFIDPSSFFNANTFHPFPLSLALTDAPLSLLPIAAPVIYWTGNALLAVNVTTIATFLLCGLAAYFLVLRLTGSWLGAVLAGIVFAFSPYRFAHLGHLQLLSCHWLPLALLFLHRLFASRRRSDAAGFAVCFVMQSLSSLYYMVFLTVATVVFAAVYGATGSVRANATFFSRLAFAWLLAWLSLIPYLLPYASLQREYGFVRHPSENSEYSAVVADYLAVPQGTIMGGLGVVHAGAEHCLFPGVEASMLALVGLAPIFTRKARPASSAAHTQVGAAKSNARHLLFATRFYLCLAVVAFTLSLGPTLHVTGSAFDVPLPFALLHAYVPGFAGLRAPSRFGVLVSLAAAVLAGFGLAELESSIVRRGLRRWAAGVIVSPMLLYALAESASIPIEVTPVPAGVDVPRVYRWLSRWEPATVLIELPAADPELNSRYSYFSTFHWLRLVNGHSSYTPEEFRSLVPELVAFPTSSGMDHLRRLKVDLVVVHGDLYPDLELRRIMSELEHYAGVTLIHRSESDLVYLLGRP